MENEISYYLGGKVPRVHKAGPLTYFVRDIFWALSLDEQNRPDFGLKRTISCQAESGHYTNLAVATTFGQQIALDTASREIYMRLLKPSRGRACFLLGAARTS